MLRALILISLFSGLAMGRNPDNVYRIPSAGGLPAYGPVNLAASSGAAVTGTLPVASGGTGTTTSTGTGSTVLSASPTFTGAISLTGSGAAGINLTATTSGTNSQFLKLTNNASSGFYNFKVGNQVVTSNHFEVVPSTAADGSTFSTPSLWVDQSGNVNAGLSLQIGSSGVKLTNYSANTLGVQNAATTPRPAVVSAGAPSEGMMIVRGGGTGASGGFSGTDCFNTSSGALIGEGYTCSRSGAGVYVVTFSASFDDIPSCTCAGTQGAAPVCALGSALGASSVTFQESTTVPVNADGPWSFICIGKRPSGS